MNRALVALIWIMGLPQTISAQSKEMSPDDFVEWHAHESAGWSALRRGYPDVAEREFKAAIERARPSSGKDPRILARTYGSLAWVLYLQGRSEDALPLAEWALTVREAYNGPDTDPVSEALYVLAMIENDLGRPDLAEGRLARVVRIQELRQGKQSLRVAGALVDLAVAQIERRKYGQARASLTRVLAIPPSVVEQNDMLRVLANTGLADIDETVGDDAEAVEKLTAAWEAARVNKEISAEQRSDLKARLIKLLRRTGRDAEASELEKPIAGDKKRQGRESNSVS